MLFMKRIWKFAHEQQLIVPGVIALATIVWLLVTGRFSVRMLTQPTWEAWYPVIVASGIFALILVVLTARDLNLELSAEAAKQVTSIIDPSGTPITPKATSRTPGRIIGSVFAVCIIGLEALAFRVAYPRPVPSPIPTPPPVARCGPPLADGARRKLEVLSQPDHADVQVRRASPESGTDSMDFITTGQGSYKLDMNVSRKWRPEVLDFRMPNDITVTVQRSDPFPKSLEKSQYPLVVEAFTDTGFRINDSGCPGIPYTVTWTRGSPTQAPKRDAPISILLGKSITGSWVATAINRTKEPIDNVGVTIMRTGALPDYDLEQALSDLKGKAGIEVGTLRPQLAVDIASLPESLIPFADKTSMYQISIFTRYEAFTEYLWMAPKDNGFEQGMDIGSNKTHEWLMRDEAAAMKRWNDWNKHKNNQKE